MNSSETVTVRQAQPREAELIAAFQIAMAKETENETLNPSVIKKGVKAVFSDPGKGCYYLAEANGEVIACMLTTYEWSDWRNGTFIWLQSVYVIPEWRGKGVFRRMYDYVKDMVKTSENLKGLRLYVFHTNQKAQGVYHAIGMEDKNYRMFEWIKDPK